EAVHKMNRKQRSELNKKNIGFVFQSYHLLDNLTVAENLDLPLSYKDIKRSERLSMVCDTLDRFQIVGKKDLYPNQLSGGQQQLVGVARAVINKPKLILADDVEAVEGVGDQRLAVGFLDVLVGQRQVQVLGDGEAVEQVIGLEDEADVLLGDLRPLLGLHHVDGLIEQVVLADPGAVEHAEDRQQRRLAGAGRPHHGDELPLPDLEVDAAQHVGGAALRGRIGLLDVAQADHGAYYLTSAGPRARGLTPIRPKSWQP
ncbi:MAG: ATP-binding cassette domain-containing protein, partial [Acidobacteria bacterium]|nr:ATP-binding cassette domain-containing protein [Acidobacteriota bacterium]